MPTITDLRTHLFDTLTTLKDKEKPMDIERAKAMADVAQVIVNTAKVEVEFLRATGRKQGTGFITDPAAITGTTKHICED
ncbi:hypothetical protein [Paraburkholderia largidicola]|uniref:Uncharacterized protein n=1 Tax=Paraburkholderia largidicola TaxID=3014751 RepID=A0A7I8C2X6_9BURK|nr:hypothetical protein [Paraburkholderia sp. PGU16]BCF94871.1 hypothetical protein PPGU16_79380 [Paraburkholderia sp. PGU16]